jgi:hypothetical protein
MYSGWVGDDDSTFVGLRACAHKVGLVAAVVVGVRRVVVLSCGVSCRAAVVKWEIRGPQVPPDILLARRCAVSQGCILQFCSVFLLKRGFAVV